MSRRETREVGGDFAEYLEYAYGVLPGDDRVLLPGLREVRMRSGITQEVLGVGAALVADSAAGAFVSWIELTDRRVPVDRAAQMASILGCDLYELLRLPPKPGEAGLREPERHWMTGLREAREKASMSYPDIVRASGLRAFPDYIKDLENCEYAAPDEEMEAIADALQVSFGTLVGPPLPKSRNTRSSSPLAAPSKAENIPSLRESAVKLRDEADQLVRLEELNEEAIRRAVLATGADNPSGEAIGAAFGEVLAEMRGRVLGGEYSI